MCLSLMALFTVSTYIYNHKFFGQFAPKNLHSISQQEIALSHSPSLSGQKKTPYRVLKNSIASEEGTPIGVIRKTQDVFKYP
jgi:hypothetical protein